MKDMKAVSDYEKKRMLAIFRGQCYNNATVIIADMHLRSDVINFKSIADRVYDLAEELYNEGMKRDYLRLDQGFDFK